MTEASIPVDLFNPGQVFACLGFLEAADVLCGDAEGGFDWSETEDVKFCLRAGGDKNPFEIVLKFLAESNIGTISPEGVEGPWPDSATPDEEFPASRTVLKKSDGKGLSASLLPVRLQRGGTVVRISHWLEIDERPTLKLFAGKQVGAQIVTNMVCGDPKNMVCGDPKKKMRRGLRDVLCGSDEKVFQDPFAEVCAVGGRFGFDARGGWDALRVGTSLDKQDVLLKVAPHVELLAAIGLENARPIRCSTYEIRYAAWNTILPITLCRVSLFAPEKFVPRGQVRFFRSHLGEDKQYKKCFFAEEETHHV